MMNNNNKLETLMQLSFVLKEVIKNESIKGLGYIPEINKDNIKIKQEVSNSEVRLNILGSLGNKIGNPYITFKFNSCLSVNDLPTDNELTEQVCKYVTS